MRLALEIIQNLLMGVGPVTRFAQRHHSTGIDSDPARVRQVYELYSRFQPVSGKEILEIGPGHTLEILETALKAGAKTCAAVDVAEYVLREDAEQKGVEYALYDGKQLPFMSQRFDLIWSYTAFEHLRYPPVTVAECFRVLRDGGSMVALIDLGDHSYYEASPPQPLKLFDCLRYPAWLWNLMRWNRSSYVNRLRKSEWMRLFRSAGFVVRQEESRISQEIADALPKLRYLKRFSYEDAVTSVLTVWLEKTNQPSVSTVKSSLLLPKPTRHAGRTWP